ncbi:MAG TPA: response regulator [Caulobacteraceae bacterium]
MTRDEAGAPGLADPRPAVLVVEENVIVRMALCESLRAAGCRVIEAFGPEDAVKVLRADAGMDVMLTELALPGVMNGVQLAGLARSLKPQLEVIITSDDLLDSDGHHLTLYEFMGKPYTMGRLVERIRALTGRSLSAP